MLTNKDISKLYICRHCLNKHVLHPLLRFKNYHLNYRYYYYHFKCTECGEMHHIVKGVKPLYALKLFFIKKPDRLYDEEWQEYHKHRNREKRKNKIKKWLHL